MTDPLDETPPLNADSAQPDMPATVARTTFDPEDVEWQRVSPKYVIVDLVGNLIPIAILSGVWIVLGLTVPDTFIVEQWWIFGAVLVLLLVNAALGVRRTKAIGYQLREDDLLFRRGIMFERIVAVPYGRMQLVDIRRGPVLRMLGLASLNFVTAAVATNVVLPGLDNERVGELRDELVALAESRRSGL